MGFIAPRRPFLLWIILPLVQTVEGIELIGSYFLAYGTDDAVDFGDLTVSTNHYSGGSPSSSTRACYGGGGFPSTTDTIEYVQIMTKGNSVDFGNLTVGRSLMMRGNCSNGHGGL